MPVKEIADQILLVKSDGESNGEILKARRESLEYPIQGDSD